MRNRFVSSIMIGALLLLGALFAVPPAVDAAEAKTPCASEESQINADTERDCSILRLYKAYFLRDPDLEGFTFWQNSDMTLAEISEFFAESKEFGIRYGLLGNADFVKLIYKNILERPAEDGGFFFWVGELNRDIRPRGQVMLEFSDGTEFRNKIADSLKPVITPGTTTTTEATTTTSTVPSSTTTTTEVTTTTEATTTTTTTTAHVSPCVVTLVNEINTDESNNVLWMPVARVRECAVEAFVVTEGVMQTIVSAAITSPAELDINLRGILSSVNQAGCDSMRETGAPSFELDLTYPSGEATFNLQPLVEDICLSFPVIPTTTTTNEL